MFWKKKSHDCRLCGRKKSKHFSQDCPKGRRLYHGTGLSGIKEISSEGLQPSTRCLLGLGTYFVESFNDAKEIALHRGAGEGGTVFECNVNLGRMKYLGKKNKRDLYTWRYEEYHPAEATHPQWFGDKTEEFVEYCLKDPKKCNVWKVARTNGHADGLGNFVISKMDKPWKELKQLNNDPKFDDVTNISRKTYIPTALPRLCCEIVFIIMKIAIFLIIFVIQVGTAVVQKRTCGYYSPAIISLIFFFILLTIGRLINCIFLIYISKLDTYERDLHFYCTLVIGFGIEMPMMISDAFIVKSCERVEAWTLQLHISYIGHMWQAWIFDSLHERVLAVGADYLYTSL